MYKFIFLLAAGFFLICAAPAAVWADAGRSVGNVRPPRPVVIQPKPRTALLPIRRNRWAPMPYRMRQAYWAKLAERKGLSVDAHDTTDETSVYPAPTEANAEAPPTPATHTQDNSVVDSAIQEAAEGDTDLEAFDGEGNPVIGVGNVGGIGKVGPNESSE